MPTRRLCTSLAHHGFTDYYINKVRWGLGLKLFEDVVEWNDLWKFQTFSFRSVADEKQKQKRDAVRSFAFFYFLFFSSFFLFSLSIHSQVELDVSFQYGFYYSSRERVPLTTTAFPRIG